MARRARHFGQAFGTEHDERHDADDENSEKSMPNIVCCEALGVKRKEDKRAGR